MQEGFVKHLYYKVTGEGESLVMIAGLGADHLSWELLANQLSHHFKIIRFDNRGIGKSSTPDDGDCTVDKMAGDVAMLLDALNISQASMIGHSLGGYVAQVYAATHPDKINKLFLLSSKASFRSVQKLYVINTMSMMKQNISRELIIKNSLCWLFSNRFLDVQENVTNFINLVMQKPFEESVKAYCYQANAVLNFNTVDFAKKIKSPTMIITGEQDILATLQDANELNQLIPGSRLNVIKKMGHMSHVEVPEAVAQIMLEFK